MHKVLAIILGGGRGKRLSPITRWRAKPAVPFGSKYRIIDFPLMSTINSGVLDVWVLTQYHGLSIEEHILDLDMNDSMSGRKIRTLSPQQVVSENFYRGTADAVYQSCSVVGVPQKIEDIVILSGDHIYKIDLRHFYQDHIESGSDFTVCGMLVKVEEAANAFGVMELDKDWNIIGFHEKPPHPKEVPGMSGYCFASMGIYFAKKDFLLDVLESDSVDDLSDHDFGKNIIPQIIGRSKIRGYDFATNKVPGESRLEHGQLPYWRDVGTLEAYYEAQMDLVRPVPRFNIYNPEWPLRTVHDALGPAKTVFTQEANFLNEFGEMPKVCNEVHAGECIFEHVRLINWCVFQRKVRVMWGATVYGSICFDDVVIEPRALVYNAIIEQGVVVPGGVTVGIDDKQDEKNRIYIDADSGIRVVTKNSFR